MFNGSGVDLYWLPLGAGGHSVRLNGRLFEAVAAGVQHRRTFDLYHAALEVRLGRSGSDRTGSDSRRARRSARRRRGRAGRRALRRADAHPSLRGAALARRSENRHRRSCGQPSQADRRPRCRSAIVAERGRPPSARVGPGRVRNGRDVELELGNLMADHAQRPGRQFHPPSSRWPGTGLAGRRCPRGSPAREAPLSVVGRRSYRQPCWRKSRRRSRSEHDALKRGGMALGSIGATALVYQLLLRRPILKWGATEAEDARGCRAMNYSRKPTGSPPGPSRLTVNAPAVPAEERS